MSAGIAFLTQRGLDQLAAHESQLARQLIQGLSDNSRVTLYGPSDDSAPRVAVVSFNVQGYHPQELATLLDQHARIQARAGFHCAPLMHQALATDQLGGTIRLSCGPFNQPADIEQVITLIERLTA
jgi:selenocysteine lyase/cysteine desulfurase